MSGRKLNTHVVAILRLHPRREELSREEVDRLGAEVLDLLTDAVDTIDKWSKSWKPAGVSGPEREALYAATWVEAARVWRERS